MSAKRRMCDGAVSLALAAVPISWERGHAKTLGWMQQWHWQVRFHHLEALFVVDTVGCIVKQENVRSFARLRACEEARSRYVPVSGWKKIDLWKDCEAAKARASIGSQVTKTMARTCQEQYLSTERVVFE